MDSMDIDSPPETSSFATNSDDRIVARLAQIGVPEEYHCNFHSGLVDFVRNNESWIPQLVSATLPSDEEVAELQKRSKGGSKKAAGVLTMKERLRASMRWLQWLMFRAEPADALNYLSELNVGERGVCGAVWGNNDIAYRCRTCEQDPTCAICVPCFENGNHKDHDYSTIYTGGGCCDCGDITAWKQEGFCSRHKGAEQIKPLPTEIAKSAQPVLDALLSYWRDKVLLAESIHQEKHKANNDGVEGTRVANELTFIVVEMLLEFCKHSESLLSFVSIRVFSCEGLLEILVRAERFLNEVVVKKLHELLLKLLAEPSFKYEFAKAFLSYYPTVVNETVKACNDDAFKDYAAISTFSVQIFTVSTLTPRLVKEMNLLAMLFKCLEEIFISTAGEEGRLQVTKWQGLYDTTIRVVEDIRFVMSHAVVPKYILGNQQEILRTWMKLLDFVQGMNPQKRETCIHIEEEIENTHLPFGLCYSIANIHNLLVNGAFSDAHFEETSFQSLFNRCQQDTDDADNLRHAKVGRLSQESSACGAIGMGTSSSGSKALDDESTANFLLRVPAPVIWLIYECLRAIEYWLLADKTFSAPSIVSSQSSSLVSSNFSAFKKLLKIRKGRYILGRFSSSEDQQIHLSKSEDNDVPMAPEDGKDSDQEVQLIPSNEGRLFSGSCTTSDDNGAGRHDQSPGSQPLHYMGMSDWPNIIYDVSSQEISVHIPLHRLLSLLLQRAINQCYGESATPLSWNPSASSFNFFEHILGRCHPFGFSAFTMEHPLRIRAFVAEVRAGMWKKNGEAALLSCEWYRSVKWSEQGLELDLFMLQCCAALAPTDLYVRRILERFGLSSYLSLKLARASEYEPVLVQEMLTLIIQIAKERRFCGLTTAESLRRELVYKLAAGDATHSQLVKALPRDLSKVSRLQEVLDTVASYSNPSGYNQGKYSLRWPYWKELDLYHPRWNSRDLQVAEERYARFCSMSALTAQLPSWTSIFSPLSRISGVATCKMTLQVIRAVLFYAVLNDKPSESRAPDTVLIPALHLLSLALDICFQLRESKDSSLYAGDSIPILAFATEELADGSEYGFGELSLLSLLVMLKKLHKRTGLSLLDASSCDLSPLIERLLKKFAELDFRCMTKLQQLAPELVNHGPQSSVIIDDTGSSGLGSDGENRKAKARQRQAAIMAKMRAAQSKFWASVGPSDVDSPSVEEVTQSVAKNEAEECAQDLCSLCHDSSSKTPLSFLIHLQKSRVASLVDRGPLSWDNVEKGNVHIMDNKGTVQCEAATLINISEVNAHSQLGQLVQDAVSKFASYGRPAEVNAFLDFVKAQFPSVRNVHLPGISNNRKESSGYNFETLEQDMYLSIKKILHSDPHLLESGQEVNSSAEQGASNEQTDGENILFGKYIACLSRERAGIPSASETVRSEEVAEASVETMSASDGFGPIDSDGIYLSSCGHAVHQGCLDRYLSSLKERYVRRIVFEGGHIVDLDQGEFLCPVCRRLANSVLPSVSSSRVAWNQSFSSSLNFQQCPSMAGSDITCLHIPNALSLLQSASKMVKKGEIGRAISLQSNARLKLRLESFINVLSKMYFPRKQEKLLASARRSRSVIMWDTLRYSIISTEISARSGRASFAPNVSLHALYKELKVSGKFVLSLFLKIIHSTRTENALDVLQRLRAIKLFADSLCSGNSSDYLNNSHEQQGDIFWILQDTEKEMSYVDIQFWKRAADPVIAHDPFSSLMWVLFCLPFPFLYSEESFISLVHVFYAVSVAQIVVTFTGKFGLEPNKLDSSSCLISDISRMMSEFRCLGQCFVSNYMDSSQNISSVIRNFTFPYLRRCALLWKLVNSSTPAPFSDIDRELDTPAEATDNQSSDVLELREIQQLEKMLKIPSVDVILKDGNLRRVAKRWLCHFCKVFEPCRFSFVVRCTPAVPFKLMELPHLYQDLLRRYIKQKCPDCKSVLEEPVLCLLCGRICSPNWKSCCRESGYQSHAASCGAGTGIFLLIRKTTILLQRSARQAPWPSPYLDVFGEEDVEMHRGKPLYLNEERYAALNHMVASHGFDRSSKVLRQTTLGALLL